MANSYMMAPDQVAILRKKYGYWGTPVIMTHDPNMTADQYISIVGNQAPVTQPGQYNSQGDPLFPETKNTTPYGFNSDVFKGAPVYQGATLNNTVTSMPVGNVGSVGGDSSPITIPPYSGSTWGDAVSASYGNATNVPTPTPPGSTWNSSPWANASGDIGVNPGITNTGFGGYSSNTNNAFGYTAQGYDPMLIQAQQYTAKGLTVTPDMLVNNQVANLMKSPVGQMAMDIAREQMNSRGMLNSSAAVNAIVQAAIKAGLPIAAQDAQTYYQAAAETLAAQNAAAQSNAAAVNTANSLNQSATNAAATFLANAKNAAGQFNVSSLIAEMQAQTSAANSETQRANTIMSWIQNIASAGLDKETVQKIANLGESAGLFSPETAAMLYQYSVTPVVSGVQ